MNKIRLTVLFLTFLLVTCNTADHNNIVLEIGKYRLTKDDLKSKRQNKKYETLTDSQFEEQLIKEGLIMAFALDNRYDTINALNTSLYYASRYYAACEGGFVWSKKTGAKLTLTEGELYGAYQKRAKELTFEVVRIPIVNWKSTYSKIVNNFDLLKEQAITDSKTTVFNMPSRFPFFPLGMYVNIPNNIKEGDVMGPGKTEDGYVIARLQSVKLVQQPNYLTQKAILKEELLYDIKQENLWEQQKEIFEKATPQVFEAAINELASKYQKNTKTWIGIDPDLVLLQYNYGGKSLAYRVANFQEFVKNEPVFLGQLNNPSDIKKMLLTDITEQYIFAEAQGMNIKADLNYQKFRNDFKERLFTEYYKRQHITPQINFQPKELELYYHKNKNNFKTFDFAIVSVYKFKSIQQALKGRLQLIRSSKSINTHQANMLTADRTISTGAITKKIKVKDKTQSVALIKAVDLLNPGQVSFPVEDDGQFLVIALKAKFGNTVLPFVYTANEIKQKIYVEKERQLLVQNENDLKNNYPVQLNFISTHLKLLKTE